VYVQSVFEYAVLRVVPNIERGECINVGVVLLCRQRRFLNAAVQLNKVRLQALDAQIDPEPLQQQLASIPLICAGGKHAGLIGELPIYERFRWLIAPRSTILQASVVHCGLCDDPAAELEALFTRMVL
jgi:Protein of unknown function (DUF3037)